MTFRIACVLVIAAQLVLLALFLRPSGRSAIVFTFVGNPLLAAGVLLALLGLLFERRRGRATNDRGAGDGAALHRDR
jgi:hypothetical protein